MDFPQDQVVLFKAFDAAGNVAAAATPTAQPSAPVATGGFTF